MRSWLVVVAVVVLVSARSYAEAPATAINAVIGDASWPSGRAGTEEQRIRAHLTYVGKRLLAREVPGEPGARRAALLDVLARYVARGEFPQRTTDGYEGRRPRFIDDRGVHCAVGFLIAASGRPELAREIDARHEYGFVREMREPALVAWAVEHGFSVDELAMIQPSYSPPPRANDVKYQIEKSVDELAARCGHKHAHVAKVALRVVSAGGSRKLTVSTKTRGPFASCVAEVAAEEGLQGHGAWSGSLSKFQFDLALALPKPAEVFARLFAAAAQEIDCRPRPGAIPTEIDLEVRVNESGRQARATTRPANAEVGRCYEEEIGRALHMFGSGSWNLKATQTLPVPPRVSVAAIEKALTGFVRSGANACKPTVQKFRVTAKAAVDAPDFVVAVDAGQQAFRDCLRKAVVAKLRDDFTTHRLVETRYLPYFRLDAAATSTVSVDLSVPEPEETINLE